MNNDSGNQLVNLIREITKIEISKEDTTCICQVDSINSDGTANIIILPDMETKINNIQNNSNNEIASGDFVVLYKIKNQINNSFIMAKCGKSVQKSRDKVVMVNYNQSEPSQIVQNAVLYTPQSLTDTQKLQARTNIGINVTGSKEVTGSFTPSGLTNNTYSITKPSELINWRSTKQFVLYYSADGSIANAQQAYTDVNIQTTVGADGLESGATAKLTFGSVPSGGKFWYYWLFVYGNSNNN